MGSSKPEVNQTNNTDAEISPSAQSVGNPAELSQDPDYLKLLDHYQRAEFDECLNLLESLEQRYPDHPILKEFSEDLQMKLSLRTLAKKSKKEQKRQKRKATFNLSVFAIVGTLVVMVDFFISSYFFTNIILTQSTEQ